MTKQLGVYFVDILEAVEEIEEFTRNLLLMSSRRTRWRLSGNDGFCNHRRSH